MRSEYRKVIDQIVNLDPATNTRVKALTIVLQDGRGFLTDDVTFEAGVAYMRSAIDADGWMVTPSDRIVGYEAVVNREECLKQEVDPTLAGALGD